MHGDFQRDCSSICGHEHSNGQSQGIGGPKYIVVLCDNSNVVRLVNIITKSGCPVKLKSKFCYHDYENSLQHVLDVIGVNNVKAIVLNHSAIKFKSAIDKYKFCFGCSDFLQKRGIYVLFSNFDACFLLGVLIKTNAFVNNGEMVVIYVSNIEGNSSGSYHIITKENGCYYLTFSSERDCDLSDKWYQELPSKYDKVFKKCIQVLVDSSENKEDQLFKDLSIFLCDRDPVVYNVPNYYKSLDEDIVVKVLSEMREITATHDLQFPFFGQYELRLDSEKLIAFMPTSSLPFQQSIIIENSNTHLQLYFSDNHDATPCKTDFELIQQMDLSTFGTSQIKVTLFIDTSGFYQLKAESKTSSITLEKEGVGVNENELCTCFCENASTSNEKDVSAETNDDHRVVIVVVADGSDTIRLINSSLCKGVTVRLKSPFLYAEYEKSIQQLLDHVGRIVIKAIVFEVFTPNLSSIQNYECRLGCYKYLKKNDIFAFFYNSGAQIFVGILAKEKPNLANGEFIIITIGEIEDIGSGTYVAMRENNGYYLKNLSFSKNKPLSLLWRRDLETKFGDTCKKFVFVISKKNENGASKSLQTAAKNFQDCSPSVFLIDDYFSFVDKGIVVKVLHEMGETLNPHNLYLPFIGVFQIRLSSTNLIPFETERYLPSERSFFINDKKGEKILEIFYACPFDQKPEKLQEIDLSALQSNNLQVVFNLDTNGFYNVRFEPINEKSKMLQDGVENFLVDSKHSDSNVYRAPSKSLEGLSIEPDQNKEFTIVFEKQCFSIFVGDKLLKDGEGLDKTPLYISFNEKRPIIGQAAKQVFDVNPNCVVFDLIELASVENVENVEINDILNSKWGFKLSKEEGHVMVSMQTNVGEKGSSIPFLIALFLRYSVKHVKKEIGIYLKNVIIKFEGFSPNETLKKSFLEAAERLHYIDQMVIV